MKTVKSESQIRERKKAVQSHPGGAIHLTATNHQELLSVNRMIRQSVLCNPENCRQRTNQEEVDPVSLLVCQKSLHVDVSVGTTAARTQACEAAGSQPHCREEPRY